MIDYPKVSILIPCYNHETFISSCLQSILLDSYVNKEIVIIDDGSTDNSDKVIKEWVNKYKEHIEILYSSRANLGICSTLNELVILATGKYVLLLASDDELCNNTILDRVLLLEENESFGKLVLVSDAIVVDSKSQIVCQSVMTQYYKANKQLYFSDRGILKEVICNPTLTGAVVLINKQIFKIIGKYPTDLKMEDWFFYQRAASINAILFYDFPVSFYRVHQKNSSGSHTSYIKQQKLIISILKTYLRNFRWFPGLAFKFLALNQFILWSFRLFKTFCKRILYTKFV